METIESALDKPNGFFVMEKTKSEQEEQAQAEIDKMQRRRKKLRVRPRRQAVPNVRHTIPNQKVEPK